MSSLAANRELEILIDRLHDQRRLRVWSIVVTIFGDVVVPRGGTIGLNRLQEIMARLRIEPGAVRAAMSRLTADGWLVRERRGRNSFYTLAATGRASFGEATQRIYAAGAPSWDGRWTIAVATEEAGEARDLLRKSLREHGFGTMGPTVFIRPETSLSPDAETVLGATNRFDADGQEQANLQRLVAQAWPLDEIDELYRLLIECFTPLAEELQAGGALEPLSALAARILLIHDFRRIVLRDPMLPAVLNQKNWQGGAARALVADIYRALLLPSEAWRSDSACNALPQPAGEFSARFGGLDC